MQSNIPSGRPHAAGRGIVTGAPLPIDALKPDFDALTGPVVITAPTGSGKSSRVPTWCEGPVLVV
ncbi:MAG: hypothetical protein KC912_12410, partial [Proteobacteria bacterium]|nr:hypothetical protein [Pseudomonadota bacterium]